MLSERRLRDWVALLDFEVASVYGYLGTLPMTAVRAGWPRRASQAAVPAAARAHGRRLFAQGAQARADADPGAAEAPRAPARAGGAPRSRPAKSGP